MPKWIMFSYFPPQITENVMEHQFKRYVKSLGRDPGSLTEAEKKELMTSMVQDLYPGKDLTGVVIRVR